MKRHITTYLTLVLVMLLAVFSSCNKKTIVGNNNLPKESDPIEFNRSTSDGFEEGAKIGVFSHPSTSSIYGTGEFGRWNIPYVQGKAKLAVAGDSKLKPIYFPDDVTLPLDFIGYSPYSDKITDDGFLLIGDIKDQSDNVNESILYSNNAVNVLRTGYSISLSFQYVMAQVIVNIKYDLASNPYGDVADITNVTLTGNNLHTYCNFYVATGDVAAVVESEDIFRGTIKMKPGVSRTLATVVPDKVTNLELKIETPGRIYRAKPSDIVYIAGKHYTYTINLKKDSTDPDDDEIYLGEISATIVDWIPDTDSSDDNVIVDPL